VADIPLFLDIDGVFHPLRTPVAERFCCKAGFERWVRKYPDLPLVISSSWRQLYPLPVIRGKFSEDVGARIIDATPRVIDGQPHARHREILAWMAKNRAPGTGWLALDDSVFEFLPGCKELVRCLPERGFDDDVAAELDRRLAQAPPPAGPGAE
jgi:hypothetical protein